MPSTITILMIDSLFQFSTTPERFFNFHAVNLKVSFDVLSIFTTSTFTGGGNRLFPIDVHLKIFTDAAATIYNTTAILRDVFSGNASALPLQSRSRYMLGNQHG